MADPETPTSEPPDPIEEPTNETPVDPDIEPIQPEEPLEEPVPIDPTLFQQFGRQAFINLFDGIGHLPNLRPASSPPITGDPEVDDRLRALANQAGYLAQPEPADTSQLVGVHQLQPSAAIAWDELSQAAQAAGHPLIITLGHLSPADQARLFSDQLGSDYSDKSLKSAFAQVMVPGYSRHQTGFVIDIVAANQPDVNFQQADAYAWLAANNFVVAKNFGFIPSQPASNPHGRSEHLIAFELAYFGRQRLLIGSARQLADDSPGG